jgi:hypothetical protein
MDLGTFSPHLLDLLHARHTNYFAALPLFDVSINTWELYSKGAEHR